MLLVKDSHLENQGYSVEETTPKSQHLNKGLIFIMSCIEHKLARGLLATWDTGPIEAPS